MATRTIVTTRPDVACDVCGRRLLRGEQPDVFLAGGERRMVCELCVSRARNEGWLREADRDLISLAPARPRRRRGLLDRLLPQRERAAWRHAVSSLAGPAGGEPTGGEFGVDPVHAEPVASELGEPVAVGGTRVGGETAGGRPLEPAPGESGGQASGQTARPVAAVPVSDPRRSRPHAFPTSEQAQMARAVEVFNAGEHPRRIASVTRSLGTPAVTVRRAGPKREDGAGQGESGPGRAVVAIVVAWELTWYRYEVELGDEQTPVSVAAEGTELDQLASEDRVPNATAGPDGALSLALAPQ